MAKNLKLNPLIFVTQLGRELNVYLVLEYRSNYSLTLSEN